MIADHPESCASRFDLVPGGFGGSFGTVSAKGGATLPESSERVAGRARMSPGQIKPASIYI